MWPIAHVFVPLLFRWLLQIVKLGNYDPLVVLNFEMTRKMNIFGFSLTSKEEEKCLHVGNKHVCCRQWFCEIKLLKKSNLTCCREPTFTFVNKRVLMGGPQSQFPVNFYDKSQFPVKCFFYNRSQLLANPKNPSIFREKNPSSQLFLGG